MYTDLACRCKHPKLNDVGKMDLIQVIVTVNQQIEYPGAIVLVCAYIFSNNGVEGCTWLQA